MAAGSAGCVAIFSGAVVWVRGCVVNHVCWLASWFGQGCYVVTDSLGGF
jgi:hypothetical protein